MHRFRLFLIGRHLFHKIFYFSQNLSVIPNFKIQVWIFK
jgi:hypothetical protein